MIASTHPENGARVIGNKTVYANLFDQCIVAISFLADLQDFWQIFVNQ